MWRELQLCPCIELARFAKTTCSIYAWRTQAAGQSGENAETKLAHQRLKCQKPIDSQNGIRTGRATRISTSKVVVQEKATAWHAASVSGRIQQRELAKVDKSANIARVS